MAGEKEKYSLYIMNADREGYEEAGRHRYARIRRGYVLIYTATQPIHSAELTDQEIVVLPKEDKDWLNYCNQLLIANFIKDNQELLESSREKFIEEFERELQKEQRKREEAYGE